MALGNEIVLTIDPRGRFMEGIIDTAEKPGTIVQIDFTQAKVGNRFHWVAYNRDADGDRPAGPFIVLLPDHLQGKTSADAYAAGDRAFGYVPLPGDELNLLIANLAGTADDHAAGEQLMVDDGTGKLVATTGTPETEVATLAENITDPVADTLAHCFWTGY